MSKPFDSMCDIEQPEQAKNPSLEPEEDATTEDTLVIATGLRLIEENLKAFEAMAAWDED